MQASTIHVNMTKITGYASRICRLVLSLRFYS